MKKAKLFGLGAVALAAGLFLGACGNNGSTDSSGGKSSSDTTTAALITDTGGVDDRSFNQSAWEGLEKWERSRTFTRK